jgi:hypothetical protein
MPDGGYRVGGVPFAVALVAPATPVGGVECAANKLNRLATPFDVPADEPRWASIGSSSAARKIRDRKVNTAGNVAHS